MRQSKMLTIIILSLQLLIGQVVIINSTSAQELKQRQFLVRGASVVGLDDKQAVVMRQAMNIFRSVMNDSQFQADLAALERVTDGAVIKPSERLKKV
jgi:hypothetical protein